MHIAKRSILTVLALLSAVFVTVASTLTLAVALAATALIVPGTGTPNANIVAGYRENARDYYISPFNPACTEANSCDLQGIDYPAQFWPIPLPGWGGLSGAKWDVSTGTGLANLGSALDTTLTQDPPNTPVIIFGYSQGANIVSREKRLLSGLPPDQTDISFVMIGNTNRPNGGLFERLAFLGHVPILDATFGMPAPTDTCDHVCATDIAFTYDGVSDFPLYPLNALAVLNAIAGFWYIHGTYLAPDAHSDVGELPDDYTPAELAAELADPANQTVYGDTRYITVPTRTLPIVRPFLEFGNFTGTTFLIKPIVDLLSPVLRVLIETGYDRTLSPGVPAPFRLIPLNINPIKLAVDLVNAVGEGIKAALGDLGVHTVTTPTPITSNTLATAKSAPAPNLATAKAADPDPVAVADNKTQVTDTSDATTTDIKVTDSKVTDTQTTDIPVTDSKVTDTQTTDIPVTDTQVTDSKTTDTQATDSKTTDTDAPQDTTPARPKVRGPIGSPPLIQPVRQFGEALTGARGTETGTAHEVVTESETKTEPDTKTATDSATSQPSARTAPGANEPESSKGSDDATAKAAA